jgi:hypothetical protein
MPLGLSFVAEELDKSNCERSKFRGEHDKRRRP